MHIISLLIIDAVGVSREKIVRKPIEVSSFRGNKSSTIVFVSLDLTMGPSVLPTHSRCSTLRRATICFSIGLGFIANKVVPSTYHQCLKAI